MTYTNRVTPDIINKAILSTDSSYPPDEYYQLLDSLLETFLIDCSEEDAYAALLLFFRKKKFSPAIRATHLNSIVSRFVDYGIDPYEIIDSVIDHEGQKVSIEASLFAFVVTSGYPSVAKFLVENHPPENVQQCLSEQRVNPDGALVVLEAARKRQWSVVGCFIDLGASPNTKDSHGDTLLHMAAHPFILKKLVACGADFTVKNNAGKYAWDVWADRVGVVDREGHLRAMKKIARDENAHHDSESLSSLTASAKMQAIKNNIDAAYFGRTKDIPKSKSAINSDKCKVSGFDAPLSMLGHALLGLVSNAPAIASERKTSINHIKNIIHLKRGDWSDEEKFIALLAIQSGSLAAHNRVAFLTDRGRANGTGVSNQVLRNIEEVVSKLESYGLLIKADVAEGKGHSAPSRLITPFATLQSSHSDFYTTKSQYSISLGSQKKKKYQEILLNTVAHLRARVVEEKGVRTKPPFGFIEDIARSTQLEHCGIIYRVLYSMASKGVDVSKKYNAIDSYGSTLFSLEHLPLNGIADPEKVEARECVDLARCLVAIHGTRCSSFGQALGESTFDSVKEVALKSPDFTSRLRAIIENGENSQHASKVASLRNTIKQSKNTKAEGAAKWFETLFVSVDRKNQIKKKAEGAPYVNVNARRKSPKL